MDSTQFSPLEETICFYTRNDFAIMNHLLIGNYHDLWQYAWLAYNDNRGIIDEYEEGVRNISSDYDVKLLNCLKKRIMSSIDDAAKETIIKNAQNDIANIIAAMSPAKEELHLYRTAWVDKKFTGDYEFAYSREYRSLQFGVGSVLEIQIISSFSITPYREDEDVGSDFYRYEIRVPSGMPILELDQFITHNEDGEILLPPMKCKVISIRDAEAKRCKGIIDLEYIKPL